MTTENGASRSQPRLVGIGEGDLQAAPARTFKSAQPVQALHPEKSTGAPVTPPAGSISSHLLEAAGAPNCVQALELISNAAQTMTSIEVQSKRIQASALALTQRTRSERLEVGQQIAALQDQMSALHDRLASVQEQLTASQARTEKSEQQLSEAEARAAIAEEWLRRLQEAVTSAFSDRLAVEEAAITSRVACA